MADLGPLFKLKMDETRFWVTNISRRLYCFSSNFCYFKSIPPGKNFWIIKKSLCNGKTVVLLVSEKGFQNLRGSYPFERKTVKNY